MNTKTNLHRDQIVIFKIHNVNYLFSKMVQSFNITIQILVISVPWGLFRRYIVNKILLQYFSQWDFSSNIVKVNLQFKIRAQYKSFLNFFSTESKIVNPVYNCIVANLILQPLPCHYVGLVKKPIKIFICSLIQIAFLMDNETYPS